MSDNVKNALALSQRAIQFDTERNIEAAIYYYKEAAKFLYFAVTNNEGSSDEQADWREKIAKYDSRAAALNDSESGEKDVKSQSFEQQALQRCNFLFGQALDADERGLGEIAVDLYGQTAEYALSIKAQINDDAIRKKILQRAEQAISRAEELKFAPTAPEPPEVAPTVKPSVPGPRPTVGSSATHTASNARSSSPVHEISSQLKVLGGTSGYSDEEKRVLLSTSKINGINYVPFMDVDLKERFQYAMPFTDKDGTLKLSPKQRRELSRWARPEELYHDPRLILNGVLDFHCIKQTIVSDCSFVASLAVSAQYERRFGKKIISTIIFPRNRNKEPIYNPFGKYMVKLHLNGVLRKVIVDDQLPVDRSGRLLCSYSTNKGELWVSLMEKAYMKVMGGYDFPGSNSNIDLHALTGWIPERIAIRPDEPDFNADAVFSMLESRLRSGHCLGTVATGDLTKQQEDRTGLVPTHAYAILNVLKVDGVCLMQLKNPWSHVRWRGNYSELDIQHWTPHLRSTLNFDPDSATMFDNGIFWIDYQSVLHFFDVFYLNWNPDIFSYTYCIHQQWRAGQGPAKDMYNMGENPQFQLKVSGTKPGSVWILLTRHITNVEDFRDNREFIAVLVYKTNGSKVYYPHDPAPYIDGVRINSPHYLCKIVLGEGSSRTFTLVVSQYEKTNNIFYTLRAFATLPFQLKKIEKHYPIVKEVSGQWKGISAGGCGNHPATYPNNPCYHIKVDATGCILIDLKGPKQYQVGFVMEAVDLPDSSFERRTSGPYRSGFVVLELEGIKPGTYSLTPTTFYPGQESAFILTVKATCPVTITKVK